jgi:hypothetical protein
MQEGLGNGDNSKSICEKEQSHEHFVGHKLHTKK